MPDETRVFDVTRPSHVNPTATSKPVIVGHQPMTHDPMVKEGNDSFESDNQPSSEPMRIQVTDESHGPHSFSASHGNTAAEESPSYLPENSPMHPVSRAENSDSPAIFNTPEAPQETDSPQVTEPQDMPDVSQVPDTDPQLPADAIAPQENEPMQPAHIEGLHFTQPPRKKNWFKLIIPLLIVIAIAGYLAIDAGVFGSGINLPFHVFKQEQKKVIITPPPPTPPPAATTPTVPTGFKEYKIEDTSLRFAAPLAWGNPSSVTEDGYSERGGENKADGVYSYTLTFEKNKDIQIVVTSNKYLPAKRTALYYDYLKWCTGTNDDKYYQSVLKFTTANGVDTPTTITCDQGPLVDVEKLTESTILQANAKDKAGKTLGDIYTKNLDNQELAVLRVKDSSMKNSDNIKLLLASVKIAPVQTTQ
jgi:hypothetical protein